VDVSRIRLFAQRKGEGGGGDLETGEPRANRAKVFKAVQRGWGEVREGGEKGGEKFRNIFSRVYEVVGGIV
jgi:hypothetical protein